MGSYTYRLPRKYRYRARRSSGSRGPLIAVAAVAALAVTAGGTTKAAAHHGTRPAPASLAAAHGGTLDCTGLAALWRAAGGSSGAAFMAAEIAMAESSGQQDPPSNAAMNSNGVTDVGYWQINAGFHPGLATTDPVGNARAAIQLSSDGTDWAPWVTYQTGAYQGQC